MNRRHELLHSKSISNRDIHPSERLVSAFPRLRPLLVNRAITQAFQKHENAAIRCKRIYTLLGRSALLFIFLGMIFVDYGFALGSLKLISNAGGIAATMLGTGLCLQLVMVLGKIKEKWLVERFAAERLRCLKFQAFALVVCSDNSTELAATVAAFTNEGIARLDQELMGGRAALDEFSPSELPFPNSLSNALPPIGFIQDAYKAYVSTRLEVQAQHFDLYSRASDRSARLPMVLSEIAFCLGGLLALSEVIWAAIWNGFNGTSMGNWFNFVSLFLFILSAMSAVYQHGTAHVPDAERYKYYAREIRRIRMLGEPQSAEEFLQIVEETEQVELRELFDFCRDIAHSSYVF